MLKILFSTILLTGLGLAISTTTPDLGGSSGAYAHHHHASSALLPGR